MDGNMIQIEFYVDRSGKMPFWFWQKSLKDLMGKTLVLSRLDRMAFGNLGDCKYLGRGIYELRIAFGPGYRIYFGKESESKIVVLCGGDKSSQKKDIKKARSYWMEYGEKP